MLTWYIRIYFGRFYTFVGTGIDPKRAREDAINRARIFGLGEDSITKECKPYSKVKGQFFSTNLS